ncbi:disease resistance TIR-NBS-LRR class family protein, partial [Tanacetum coccineum]
MVIFLRNYLGQLDCLEKLYVSSKKIEYLPDSICLLKCLKWLDIRNCFRIGKLPEDIGRLECLKVLDITDTGISHLPQSIFGLKGLVMAAYSELLQLYDFPSEIKTTSRHFLCGTLPDTRDQAVADQHIQIQIHQIKLDLLAGVGVEVKLYKCISSPHF